MKFPRNAKIFRGQLDAAPFAAIFFLLVMFMMMSTLVYTPGIPMNLELPTAVDIAGTDKISTSVAVDANGRLYYQNQVIELRDLRSKLKEVVKMSHEPMALIIQADKKVSYEMLIRLALAARNAGFAETRLAALPQSPAAQPATR